MNRFEIYEVFNVLGFSEGFVLTSTRTSGIEDEDYRKFIKKVEEEIGYAVSEVKFITCLMPNELFDTLMELDSHIIAEI